MMKIYRSIPAFCLLVSCFFLAGFKQHVPKAHATTKKQVAEGQKQRQKLDLSVPNSDISFQNPPEILATAQTALPGVDINRKKIKERTVDLEGEVILVQEQEAGKIKSADGAGIIINLRH